MRLQLLLWLALSVITQNTHAQRTLDPAEENPIRIPYEEIQLAKYDSADRTSLGKPQLRARAFERKMVVQLRTLDQRLGGLGYRLSTNALTRAQRLERTKYLGGTMTTTEMDQYEASFNSAVQNLASRISQAESILEEAKPQHRRRQAAAVNNKVHILPPAGPGQPGWGDQSRSPESITQEARQHQLDENWQSEQQMATARSRLAAANETLEDVKNKAPMGMRKWDDPAVNSHREEEIRAQNDVDQAQGDLNRARSDNGQE